MGRRPHRRDDRVRGPRHRRRGVPRAGAELRWLLPAARRVLRARPRDLRRVRRAARRRRGHLRVRAHRVDVRVDDFGFEPDMITCAKGMTSGYSPIGAMIASDRLFEPFKNGTTYFPHGYTFGGHPVSAAVALANLDIFEREGLNAARQVPDAADLQGDARPAARPAARRRRARRRVLLRHRARQGQGRRARPSTTPSPSACCAASCPRRSSTPGSTAAPTTAATPSSSSRRRSSSGQERVRRHRVAAAWCPHGGREPPLTSPTSERLRPYAAGLAPARRRGPLRLGRRADGLTWAASVRPRYA